MAERHKARLSVGRSVVLATDAVGVGARADMGAVLATAGVTRGTRAEDGSRGRPGAEPVALLE